jgi:hypothetical protein
MEVIFSTVDHLKLFELDKMMSKQKVNRIKLEPIFHVLEERNAHTHVDGHK